MKKEVFANYAENCSKLLKILKFLTLKMPEFVTCKFVKRLLKTNRIWREKKKKLKNSDFGKTKKTEMIVCETWKFIRNE